MTSPGSDSRSPASARQRPPSAASTREEQPGEQGCPPAPADARQERDAGGTERERRLLQVLSDAHGLVAHLAALYADRPVPPGVMLGLELQVQALVSEVSQEFRRAGGAR